MNSSAHSETTPRGVDKVRRYGWTQVDKPGQFQMLHKSKLAVDDAYQRAENAPKVLQLASGWSWVACGAIVVAERDGGDYFVIDGQHRVLAAKRRSDIKELPCLVYRVGSISAEANAFLMLNSNRKPVSALAKHKASAVAGDELSIFLEETISDLGIELTNTPKHAGQMKAIAWCKKAAAADRDGFQTVLMLARDICSAVDAPIHERLLSGLLYLHVNVPGGLNDDRLVRRIHTVGAHSLLQAANRASAYFARGGEKVFATGMLEEINKGLRNRFEFASAAGAA